MSLSPHFTLEELTNSETALRLGIDNTPPAEIVEHLRSTAEHMEQVRSLLGGRAISVNSGYRCEELERVICAKDFAAWCVRRGLPRDDEHWAQYFAAKAHPKGWSVDWVCPAFGSPLQIVRYLAKTSLQFDQLIMEGTWVHSSFDVRLRRQVLTAAFSGGVPNYSQGA